MEINNRTKVLGIVLGVVVAILVGRLFQIQILDGSYKRDSSNNSMIYETIYPPRGIIYDRDGRVLVGNKVCYDILVTPREVTAFDTLALADALGVTPEFVRERMSYYRERRRSIGYQTLTFVKQLPVEQYMRFAETAYAFPGFRGQVRSVREYPFDAGGNLLGYMGEVNAAEIKAEPEAYKAGDYIGKTGLEAIREKELRGRKGYHIFLRDSRNRRQDAYADGEFDQPAEPGTDIVTTIDAPLQQYGQRLMAGKKGSLIGDRGNSGDGLEPRHLSGRAGEYRPALRSPCDGPEPADVQPHRAGVVPTGLGVQARERPYRHAGRGAGTVVQISVHEGLRLFLET